MSKLHVAWLTQLIVFSVLPASADEAAAPSAAQISTWIRDLDSEDYAARETAGLRLVEAGKAAVAPVAKAILSDSPEAAWRANDVLEQIGITGDEATLELVSRALADVSKSSKHTLAKSTSQVQRRWKLLRHERAVTQIAKLGGHVRGSAEGDLVAFGGIGGFAIAPAMAVEAMPLELIEEVEVEAEAVEAVEEAGPEERPAPRLPAPLRILRAFGPFAPFGGRIEVMPDIPLPPEFKVPVDLPPDPPAKALEEVELPLSGKIEILPTIPAPAPAEIPVPAEGPFGGEPVPVFEDPVAPPPPKGLFGKVFGKIIRDLLPVAPPEMELPDVEAVEAEAEAFIPGDVEFAEVGMAVDFESFESVENEDGAHAVRLGKEWKGGAEGLKLLKDVAQLAALELHELDITAAHVQQIGELPELRQLNLQRCRFDRAAVETLKKSRPDLTVLAYGEAVMGISGEPRAEGFYISFVAPGSGAHLAGIQVGDVVARISGEELKNFEQLTHVVASRKIGDKVPVDVLRQGKKLALEVTLKARGAN